MIKSDFPQGSSVAFFLVKNKSHNGHRDKKKRASEPKKKKKKVIFVQIEPSSYAPLPKVQILDLI
jgi:hypothetical protein